MDLQSTDQKSMIHKKSNFDFLVNIEFQRSRFIKTFKNIKLDHQESRRSRKVNKNSRFPILRKFLSVFILDSFTTSWPFFTMMQDDSWKTFNMKVVDIDEFYNFILGLMSKKCLDLKI